MKASLNIGTLQGRLLVFGGVYSNLQALEALYEIAQKEKIPPENIICTGDVVAYCSQPNECVSLIKDWGIHCIAGNVEENLSNGVEDCGCNFAEGSRCDMLSQQWYPFARTEVSDSSLAWIKELPFHLDFSYAGKKFGVVHGSYDVISEYIFASSPWKVKQEYFDKSGMDVILSGHCGLPFSEERKEKHWLNPGVIGMPANDGTPRTWYMILEEEEEGFSYTHHALEYDHVQTSKRMRLKGLPDAYADTLIDGLWDNNDILPEEETSQQGVRITLADPPGYVAPSPKPSPLHQSKKNMSNTYYNPKDLNKFGDVSEWQPELGEKYFEYYGSVFKDGELSAREKALIALAVSHAIQCPYCIDMYTKNAVVKGYDEGQMMEALHVATAIQSGSVLIHGVQMMQKAEEIMM